MQTLKKAGLIAALCVAAWGLPSCNTPFMTTIGVQFTNPSWAPPYYNGVRYYYLPDIETYYDLQDRNFVYLDNGQWRYSPSLPSVYGSYDLFNGFVIALNITLYQPWMHHQYYVSHYPRYYYNNVYQPNDRPNIRGYNENDRKPIYWRQEDRDRLKDLRRNDRPEVRNEPPRQPQNTNYYGRKIGQPVKVTPKMRQRDNKPGGNRPE